MDIDDFIAETARGAGEIIMRGYGQVGAWRSKVDRGDVVTEVDLASERYIIDRITSAFPEHGIVSEEAGHLGAGGEGYTWYIDPLDGTRNYTLGIPFFSVSIALAKGGVAERGAVYDPLHDELFLASRGQGATMNGASIHVSGEGDLEDAVISISWIRRRVERTRFVGFVERIARRTSYFRRFGSAALVTAYVAAGRVDAYVQGRINNWDIAAGTVLIEEAGGLATDFAGQPIDLTQPSTDILAANPVVHGRMMDEVILSRPAVYGCKDV